MTTVENVCDYIILRLSEAQECVNMLKLQKLLYYCQAWNLAIHDEELFRDDFQAWIHGPVNRTIYDRFKDSKSLYSQMSEIDIRSTFNIMDLSPRDKNLIDSVLEVYAKYSGTQLEQLTHMEDPWTKAREGYSPAQRCEEIIDKDLMRSYYKSRLQH